jgi:hypothetical protein
MKRANEMVETGFGELTEITDEKEVIRTSA